MEEEVPDINLKETIKEGKQERLDKLMEYIKKNMEKIKHKIVVISGKGGVGKTTVAVNLAMSLASIGLRVGILDVDITGPNVLKMLGIPPELKPMVDAEAKRFYPVNGPLNMKVMSMAFLIENSDSPVIWRGPMKMSAVRQFLGEAIWGDLDYLICDLPPGTSDETLDILQLIPEENIIVVSTPQEVALMDARKTIKMAQIMERNVLGIIENMSTFKCPSCGSNHNIFGEGGGMVLAKEFQTDLLGQIPLDPVIRVREDEGINEPFSYFLPIAEKLLRKIKGNSKD